MKLKIIYICLTLVLVVVFSNTAIEYFTSSEGVEDDSSSVNRLSLQKHEKKLLSHVIEDGDRVRFLFADGSILTLRGQMVVEDDYCKGWSKGYTRGYCQGIPSCLPPTVPVCPIPDLNCNSGFRCGYERGLAKGSYDRGKRQVLSNR
ncbi:MAG: hypothetical protein HRU18_03860 [Pseudoalteromonas sp.]|uniref:hypothetical protein n=1 Tax=Pseudoalteromonas sp. TaxID=53249 RepID=UPI001DB1756B|nr:hypothetical protein [Pseudoalteromonas sp.]NRA77323.1 hypothetical protein [Pseudoalteromonas sp.]